MIEDDEIKEILNDPNYLLLNPETGKALYEYLKHEFISYEHHPKVIELVKLLREKFYGR